MACWVRGVSMLPMVVIALLASSRCGTLAFTTPSPSSNHASSARPLYMSSRESLSTERVSRDDAIKAVGLTVLGGGILSQARRVSAEVSTGVNL